MKTNKKHEDKRVTFENMAEAKFEEHQKKAIDIHTKIESKIEEFFAWKNDRSWSHADVDYKDYLYRLMATLIKEI